MSLKLSIIEPVLAETIRIARASFPKCNLYLSMRDELGIALSDTDFAELFHVAFSLPLPLGDWL